MGIDEIRKAGTSVSSVLLAAALDAALEYISSLETRAQSLECTLKACLAENSLLKRSFFGVKSERTNTNEFQTLLPLLFPGEEALRPEFPQWIYPTHRCQTVTPKILASGP